MKTLHALARSLRYIGIASILISLRAQTAPITDNDLFVSNHNLAGSGAAGIVHVDKTTGAQTVVTTGQYFGDLFAIAVESPTTLLAVDASGLLVRVDLTGAPNSNQTLIASGLGHAVGLALDGRGDAYVADDGFGGPGAIRRIHLANGNLVTTIPGGRPGQLTFHPDGHLYFSGFAVNGQPGIARVDIRTDQWTVVTAGGYLQDATQLAVDGNGDLLTAEPVPLGSETSRIVRIDVQTGTQTPMPLGPGSLTLTSIWSDLSGRIFVGDTANRADDGLSGVHEWNPVTGTLTPLTTSGTNHHRNLTVLAGPVRSCAETAAALEAELALANAEIASQAQQIAGLLSDNAALQTQVAALQSDVAGLENEVAALHADIAGLQNEVAALQTAANASQQSLDALRDFFRTRFNAPNFVIPGATTSAQIASLTAAVEDLNRGQQQALFRKLGGSN